MNQPRILSPAMLVAVLALVAALAGTALGGPDASTSAITMKKVKKIATTEASKYFDAKIANASVASAKTANTADVATNAQNAAAVGGVGAAGINYSAPAVLGDTGQTIYNRAGLRLEAVCGEDFSITATTTMQNSSIYTSVDTVGNPSFVSTTEDGGFDVGVNFNLAGAADHSLITFEYDTLDGSSVTGIISTDIAFTPDRCEAHGNVLNS